MAELAASIVGIISAGAKITIVLFRISEELGTAGKEARLVASEISTFCAVLKTLHESLSKIESSAYFSSCRVAVADMTAASMRMYDEVLDAADELRKISAKGAVGVKGKVGWVVFQRPKITMLRAAMESYKSTLSLMLETISVTEKVARLGSGPMPSVEEVERDSATLESLKLAQKGSLFLLDEAQQLNVDVNEPRESPQTTSHDERPSEEDECLTSIRAEINSFRLSHTSPVATDEELSGRAASHSEDISRLFDDDHRRLSQRWSLALPASRFSWDRPMSDTLLTPVSAAGTKTEQSHSSTVGAQPLPSMSIPKEADTSEQAAKFFSGLGQLHPDHTRAVLQFLQEKYGTTMEDLEPKALLDEEFSSELQVMLQWWAALSQAERIFAMFAFTTDLDSNRNYNTIADCAGSLQAIVSVASDRDFVDELNAVLNWSRVLSITERAKQSYTFLQYLHNSPSLPIISTEATPQEKRSLPLTAEEMLERERRYCYVGDIPNWHAEAIRSRATTALTPHVATPQEIIAQPPYPSKSQLMTTNAPFNPVPVDIPTWLRSIRLHKYTDNLKDLSWHELIQLSDEELEKLGVRAIGARRKLLKTCKQVNEARGQLLAGEFSKLHDAGVPADDPVRCALVLWEKEWKITLGMKQSDRNPSK
jgi:hypothetical protein